MLARALAGGLGEAGFEHLVLRDGVDDLFVLLLELDEQLAQLGVGEGLDRGLRRAGGTPGSPAAWSGSSASTRPRARSLSVRPPAACGDRPGRLAGRSLLQAGEAGGDDDSTRARCCRAPRPAAASRSDTDFFWSIGRESVLSCSHTPTQSTMTKWSLALASGVTLCRSSGVDDAHAAALHLLEEGAALHRAHEHHDLHRLDVGAGGDHVHGDGDARVVAVAEGGDQVARASRPWCGR